MNRLARWALGVTGVAALTFGGLPMASATDEHDDHKPEVTVGEWEKYDDKYVIDKGYACKGAVKARSVGKVRVTTYEKGDKGVVALKLEFADWSYSTYAHTKKVKKVVKHHRDKKIVKVIKVTKKVKVGEGGDAIIKIDTKKGDGTAYGYHEGENTFWGKGVYGLVYTEGKVKTRFSDFGTPNEGVTILKAEHAVELCKKIGTKPVWGKNPPIEEAPQGDATMAAAARGKA